MSGPSASNDVRDFFRLVSFNVCGVRNVLAYDPWNKSRTFKSMFDIMEADIICFQETKVTSRDLNYDTAIVPGFDAFYTFPRVKQGYSGVAIYTRRASCVPIKAEDGITGYLKGPDDSQCYRDQPEKDTIGGYVDLDKTRGLDIDSEGRALVLDFGLFVLIGVYCPADSMGKRNEFRTQFLQVLDARIRNLVEIGRQVILMGDVNIARDMIDRADAKESMRKANLKNFKDTPPRILLDRLLLPNSHGVLIDLCRDYFPNRKGMYTCWSQLKNARPSNFGSRVDYILATSGLNKWFYRADIRPDLMGSDHCPVFADMRLESDGVHLKQLVHPGKVAPPRLATKYMGQFYGRGNLSTMFASMKRKSQTNSTTPTTTPEQSNNTQVSTTTPPPPEEKGVGCSTSPLPSKSPVQSKKRRSTNGQMELSTFFKRPKTPATSKDDCKVPDDDDYSFQDTRLSENDDPKLSKSPNHLNNSLHVVDDDDDHELIEENDKDFAVKKLKSATKWQNLLSPPSAPLCDGHNEPAILQTTKKQGPNTGRAFWSCARLIGPSEESKPGHDGKPSEYKCNFFKWKK